VLPELANKNKKKENNANGAEKPGKPIKKAAQKKD
jgi:hypothetical protein